MVEPQPYKPLHYKSLFLLEGIVFIILGILAIALPGFFTLSVEILLGSLILLAGIVQFVRAFQGRKEKGFFLSLISSLAYIALGILFLSRPLLGVVTLTILLMFFFLFEGIVKIGLALEIRPAEGWGWLAFSGFTALVMAFLIWSGWPGTAFWVIGLLLGIDMVFFGTALLMVWFRTRKAN